MQRYEPAGDLASRDLVARAIVREVAAHRRAGLPVDGALDPDYVRSRFPTIAQACRRAGFDLATDRIPVSPAAHYVMGGVETDLDGRTSIAQPVRRRRGGVHRRARRQPAGQQLAARGAGVRRARRGGDARTHGARRRCRPTLRSSRLPTQPAARREPSRRPSDVRDLMWRHAGLVRDRATASAPLVQQLAAWRAAASRRARRGARRSRAAGASPAS